MSQQVVKMRDFKIPSRSREELPYSELLRSE